MSEFIKVKVITKDNEKINFLVKKYNTKIKMFIEKENSIQSEKTIEKINKSNEACLLFDSLKVYYNEDDNDFEKNSLLNSLDKIIKEANYSESYIIEKLSLGIHLLQNRNNDYLFNRSFYLMKSTIKIHYQYNEGLNIIGSNSSCSGIILTTRFKNNFTDEAIKKMKDGKN